MTVQQPVQNATLILRVCGTCLNEIAALRREVKLVLERIPELPKPASPTAKAVCDSVSSINILTPGVATLRALCSIEDSALSEHLVTAFQAGELSIELHDLVNRIQAQSADVTLPALREAILAEFGRGTLRAVALRAGEVESDPLLVQAAISHELQDADGESSSSTATVIAISPTFCKPERPLLEALLRCCERSRLAVPMDLLCKAICGSLAPEAARRERKFDEVALVALLNDKLTSRENEILDVTAGGRVFVRGSSNALPPFGDDAKKELDKLDGTSSRFDVPSLKDTLDAVGQHLHTLLALCGLGSGRGVDDHAPWGLILGLLGTLRVQGAARALGLPQALSESCGAALVWALECTLSRKEFADVGVRAAESNALLPAADVLQDDPATGVDKVEMTLLHVENDAGHHARHDDDPAETSDCECAGLPLTSLDRAETPFGSESTAVGSHAFHALSMGSLETPFGSEGTVAGGAQHQEDSHPSPAPPSSPPGAECLSPESAIGSKGVAMPARHVDSAGMPTAGEEESGAKRLAKMLFVQCFKDDLLQARHLLLSQVNNLYKMRNSGEPLPYKAAGYEKLHDFVVNIAGLGLQGSGNRMEVRVIDRIQFEELCENTEDDPDVPVFQKPLPVPESFQQKVIEVFRRMGTREIVAKTFRDVWNSVFPDDKLQVKEFGYRDVRGLLANVPIVDRVGGKYFSKYVLKDDVPLTELEDMPRTMSTPASGTSQQSASGVRQDNDSQESFGDRLHSLVSQASLGVPQAPFDWNPGLGLTSLEPERNAEPIKAMVPSGLLWNQRPFDSSMTPFNTCLPGASHPVDGFGTALGPPGIWSGSAPAPPSQPQRHVFSESAPAPPHMQTPPQTCPRMPAASTILSNDPAREARVSLASDLSDEVGRTLKDLAQQEIIANPDRAKAYSSSIASPSTGCLSSVGGAFDPAADPEFAAVVTSNLPPGLAGAPLRNPIVGATNVSEGAVDTSAVRRSRQPSHDLGVSTEPPSLPFLSGRPAPMPLKLEVDGEASSDTKKWQSAPPDLTPQSEGPTSVSSSGGDMFRKMRKARKTPKAANQFVSSPGAFSSQDFDASKHQGKFDMGFVYQAALRHDRPALIVDIYNGRVLFTNSLCDCLFEHIVPLPNREVVDLIHEDDRIQFSASVMYLNIGKFNYMEPQRMRINSSRGVLWALFSGTQLADTWWRFHIEEDSGEGSNEEGNNTGFANLLSNNPVSL